MSTGIGGVCLLVLVVVALLPAPRSAAETADVAVGGTALPRDVAVTAPGLAPTALPPSVPTGIASPAGVGGTTPGGTPAGTGTPIGTTGSAAGQPAADRSTADARRTGQAAAPASTRTATSPATTSHAAKYYRSCTEVRAAGAAPLRAGQPGYRSGLDPDGDGVACGRPGDAAVCTSPSPTTPLLTRLACWFTNLGRG